MVNYCTITTYHKLLHNATYVPYMVNYCANATYQKLLHNATYMPYMVNYCANMTYQNFQFHTTQIRGASLRLPQLMYVLIGVCVCVLAVERGIVALKGLIGTFGHKVLRQLINCYATSHELTTRPLLYRGGPLHVTVNAAL